MKLRTRWYFLVNDVLVLFKQNKKSALTAALLAVLGIALGIVLTVGTEAEYTPVFTAIFKGGYSVLGTFSGVAVLSVFCFGLIYVSTGNKYTRVLPMVVFAFIGYYFGRLIILNTVANVVSGIFSLILLWLPIYVALFIFLVAYAELTRSKCPLGWSYLNPLRNKTTFWGGIKYLCFVLCVEVTLLVIICGFIALVC